MGTFLHRTNKTLLRSVSPNSLPEPIANYIEEPDLSAVQGVPSRYWNIVGDAISEMSQAEKDAVDSQMDDVSRDALMQEHIDDLESVLRQIVVLIVDEINILRNQFNTTTSEVPQLTDTAFTDRTLAQVKTKIRQGMGS